VAKPMSYIFNSSAEIAAATFPNVRLFSVPPIRNATTPQDRFDDAACSNSKTQDCTWKKLSPQSVASFSAVCYLTAKELVERQVGRSYPIGLVYSAVGGTEIQQWMPADTLDNCAATSRDPAQTSKLFNGMVAPLVGFSLKMVLFYQGEANSHTKQSVAAYGCQFRTLINSWRDLWGFGDFSFIFAQLAPFSGGGPLFADLRLQQAASLPTPGGDVDTTGMAVLSDIGDKAGGIHPHNKSEVGRRLALQAMHVAYAKQEYTAPGHTPVPAPTPPCPVGTFKPVAQASPLRSNPAIAHHEH
jgi:sialate O-acetylesterase